MAEPRLYLRDLKDGRFVVKKFVIKGDVVYPESTQEANNGEVDIMVLLDNCGSYLLLTDNFDQVYHDVGVEARTMDRLSDNSLNYLFIEKLIVQSHPRILIGFYEPWYDSGCYDVLPHCPMQKMFNDLMVVEMKELKTIGARFYIAEEIWGPNEE